MIEPGDPSVRCDPEHQQATVPIGVTECGDTRRDFVVAKPLELGLGNPAGGVRPPHLFSIEVLPLEVRIVGCGEKVPERVRIGEYVAGLSVDRIAVNGVLRLRRGSSEETSAARGIRKAQI